MPARVTPAWVHPGSCTGATISLRYEISQRYHVNAKRAPVSLWNPSAGRLEKGSECVMFAILNHTCTLPTWSVPWNNKIWNDPVIMWTRFAITKSHPGLKLAPVRIFSCKHHLSKTILDEINTSIISCTWINQRKITSSVLKWFIALENKETLSFICFDVCDFYTSINGKLLSKAMDFAP